MMDRRLREVVAEASFTARLLEALRSPEFQTACIQRLVAATIDAAEGFRVVDVAIERVRAEAPGPGSNLASRILQAIDEACASHAEIRRHPYRKILGPATRSWPALLRMAGQAGLTEEETYAFLRDFFRRTGPQWSQVRGHVVDRELLEELSWAFSVLENAKWKPGLAGQVQLRGVPP